MVYPPRDCSQLSEFSAICNTFSHLGEKGKERIKLEKRADGTYIPKLVSKANWFERIFEVLFGCKDSSLHITNIKNYITDFFSLNSHYIPYERDAIMTLKGRVTPKANLDIPLQNLIDRICGNAEAIIAKTQASLKELSAKTLVEVNEIKHNSQLSMKEMQDKTRQEIAAIQRETLLLNKSLDLPKLAAEIRLAEHKDLIASMYPQVNRIFAFKNDEESKDITFICRDGEIKAHSIILSETSPIFKYMNGQIDLKEFPLKAVELYLDGCYGCDKAYVDSTIETIAYTHSLALLLKDNTCEINSIEALKNATNSHNISSVLKLIEKFPALIRNSEENIFYTHFVKLLGKCLYPLIKSGEMNSISHELLFDVLGCNNLTIIDEDTLLNELILWAESQEPILQNKALAKQVLQIVAYLEKLSLPSTNTQDAEDLLQLCKQISTDHANLLESIENLKSTLASAERFASLKIADGQCDFVEEIKGAIQQLLQTLNSKNEKLVKEKLLRKIPSRNEKTLLNQIRWGWLSEQSKLRFKKLTNLKPPRDVSRREGGFVIIEDSGFKLKESVSRFNMYYFLSPNTDKITCTLSLPRDSHNSLTISLKDSSELENYKGKIYLSIAKKTKTFTNEGVLVWKTSMKETLIPATLTAGKLTFKHSDELSRALMEEDFRLDISVKFIPD